MLLVDHVWLKSGVTDFTVSITDQDDHGGVLDVQVYAKVAPKTKIKFNTGIYSTFRFETYKPGKKRKIIVACYLCQPVKYS